MTLPYTPVFPEARWRRVGASDEQLVALQSAWDGMNGEQQLAEDHRVRGLADTDLKVELGVESKPEAVPGAKDSPVHGTIDEVMQWVNGDGERAGVALSHEQAAERPRPRLVEELNKVISASEPHA